MKTIFIEDRAYDGYMIWVMLQGEDPAGVEKRWESSGIDKETLLKIQNSSRFEDVQERIVDLVDTRYKKEGDAVRESIAAYQASWDRISDVFYTTIASITGQPWKFSEYKVVVSLFHRGVSNRDSNVVVRLAGIDPHHQNRITAHEILMTHLWNIFDVRYPAAKEDPLRHFWAMNEITTVCLLGLEPVLNALWTEETKGTDRYLQNYPQLKTSKQELEKLYLEKKDFNGYLSNMISRVESPYGNINLGRPS